MADVNISKYTTQVVREGSKPASPGFVVSEGQSPTDPAGSGQNHLPVTIAAASTGLAITESQILGGAGTVGQYIRGDGSLADFPATTGGGSSVSYYLNGSVSQGTISGVAYKELNRTPVFGAGTDISINADGYIASFITDAGDPNKLLIPAGNWNFETYFSASSSGGSPSFYVELYKYNGSTFTLIASSSSSPELIAFGTSLNPYFSTLAVPETVLALTDRLAVRFYVNHSGRTITLHTEDNHLCQVITTFTTGLTALNGLTSQVQFFAVGTSGTDFAISSATDTHTFNLPTASGTNRGALSAADWSTFNGKENAITAGTTAQYFRGDKTFQTLNTSVVPEGTNLYYTEARVNANTNVAANTAARHNAVTLGTANGLSLSTQVLSLGLASAGVTGALSGTDWSTFNSKQNALTNPVTGTGTTNYLPKFTGSTTIAISNLTDGGVTISNANPTAGQFAWQFNGNTTTGQSFGASVVAGTNSSDISFRVLNAAANSTYFTINGSGNVLVGTTTDNGAKLQTVGGPVSFTGVNDGTAIFARRTGGANVFALNVNLDSSWTMYDYASGSYLNGITQKNGNVGIGVSPSAWDTGNTVKAVEISQGALWGYGTTNVYLASNYYWSGSNRIYLKTAAAGEYSITNGSHQWFTAPSGTAGNAISFTQAMTLTSGGNLLVGTTTDAGFKLDVNGTAKATKLVSASNAFAGTLDFGTGSFKGIMDYSASSGLWSLNNQTAGSSTTAYFQFQADSSPIVTMLKNGNVGIGTSSPSVLLHLNTTETVNNIFRISNGTQQLNLGVNNSGGGSFIFESAAQALRFGTSDTERFRISSTGFVSAGATTNGRLGVRGFTNDSSGYSFEAANASGNTLFIVRNDGATTVSGKLLVNTFTPGSSPLRLVSLPTSSAGLSSGDVWNDSGTLKIA